MNDGVFVPVIIAGLSHHSADAAVLEKFRFPDERAFLNTAHERCKGVVLLQTCNRVEVIAHGDPSTLITFLQEGGRPEFSVYSGIDALRHLLEVACGIDSMIVGEDQILGQLKDALLLAQSEGVSDHITEILVTKAVHLGTGVRSETRINRGAVSVGSAAVQLAEAQIGSLTGRHILVIGSGEMGMLVAQALAAKNLSAIYVANRTYARAEFLAEKIGGRAVRMSELSRYLILSDVVISCTSAPHPVIRCGDLREVMKGRCWPLEGHPRPLIIIDIAQPRDVEEGAGEINGVTLFSIDDLREVNDATLAQRLGEAARARDMIEQELGQFTRLVNSRAADAALGELRRWAEAIRVRERDRAMSRLCNLELKTHEVIDDFSRVMMNKLLADATLAIRSCAETGNLSAAESLVAAITRGERLCFHKEG
ncbi:MAG: glutamyl-tRNA reductase [Methanomicrobiales archaeon]|jgi:glutamyl-tRNA reductase|nr:glutamyl-tRNA reductase [Methanomicrobiales archaeon]